MVGRGRRNDGEWGMRGVWWGMRGGMVGREGKLSCGERRSVRGG